jgi:hypothetical protein
MSRSRLFARLTSIQSRVVGRSLLTPQEVSGVIGWEVFVTRQGSDASVGHWRTSVFGLKWLDQLVEERRAVDLGGDGYPNRYSVSACVLLPIITGTLPNNASPLVIGEDYVIPAGWSGVAQLDPQVVAACHPDEQLLVEVWDQS